MATHTELTGAIVRIYHNADRGKRMIEGKILAIDAVGVVIERDVIDSTGKPLELGATEMWPWSSIDFLRVGASK